MATNKALAGKVCWVSGADGELGRAVALELGARSASVVVSGSSERKIAEVVGEIAFGGGKAKHVVAAPSDEAASTRAARVAIDAFGGLDLAVDCAVGARDEKDVSCTLSAARAHLREGGAMLALAIEPRDPRDLDREIASLARAVVEIATGTTRGS